MANKKKRSEKAAAAVELNETEAGGENVSEQNFKTNRTAYLKRNWWAVGIIALLSFGAFGAGLKYLEQDAARVTAERSAATNFKPANEGLLSKVNPFLSNPTPTPTPQLSKEYIYAGSRLLAVEDANATAVPPADLAIWRPSSGQWWVMGGPGSQATTVSWGASTDIPVPGDYDGDGKTDFSVFRPSEGNWYILPSSSSSGYTAYQFGQSGDIPAPADFDGDGKTDAAVFRSGTWYIKPSSNGNFYAVPFGLSTDIPAPADYDGDGKADIAVWREGTGGVFYVLRSVDATLQTGTLGTTGDKPVAADYDGDGKADFAVRSGADWKFLYSANNQTQTISWQQASDKAVHNDYDGDGKVDIAVWRDSNGTWYIRQSSLIGQSGELRQQQWGASGDIPVPAFYRR